jgi:hypothetical protein
VIQARSKERPVWNIMGSRRWCRPAGVALRQRKSPLERRLSRWNHGGISGLLPASLAGMVWMLPLAMDAALDEPRITLAKSLGVPLLIGVAIALSRRRAGFAVRGVVLLELIASMLRLGWFYLISPVRMCSNYLLDDQQRLGKILLVAGFAILLVLVWKLMWGHVDSERATRDDSPAGPD